MYTQGKELTQIDKVCQKEFEINQGPFVRGLDKALESFNVHMLKTSKRYMSTDANTSFAEKYL